VNGDGSFVRVDGKEQVWDPVAGTAQPAGAKGVDPALEGDFTVGCARVKTAFQLFKEHVARSTPEWAAQICGVPAEAIRRIGLDLGRNAMIGSTITLDGVTLPYRPVSVMAYHMAQQEQGFQAIRAMIMTFMLVGAVEAVGGVRIDFTWKIHGNHDKFETLKIKDPPYNLYLADSKFFPINSNNSGVVAKVMQNPSKYGVDFTPEVLIVHMANPLGSFASQQDFLDSYKKFKFVAVIDPWLSETADYFADVILPAATIEKYEGPINAADQYVSATTLRVPPMKPLFFKLVEFKQSRSSFIPLLAELAPEQRLEINPKTAKAKGVKDGDMVWVESHNALTGETRKVKVRARLSEGIRPDTVGMPHHYGLWTHPEAKAQGPTPNILFFTGEGYVTNTADQSFQVKVRVSKA